ncbi:MAG: TolB family protein [Planctomycetota bacterium]|jgi:dipeptidyl aminopeptidase/acylaminoacyl peptidase
MIRRNSDVFTRAGAAAVGCLLLAVGCSSSSIPVRVETKPAGLPAVIKEGDKQVRAGKPPLTVRVSKRDQYSIEVKQEGYLPTVKKLDYPEAQKLPKADGETRVLTVEVKRKEFQDIEQLLIIYDRARGFVGARKTVRAFTSIVERGGRAPTRLLEVPKDHGIRGIAMSPKGDHIVFADAVVKSDPRAAGPGENAILKLKSCNLSAIRLGGGGVIQLTRQDFLDLDAYYTPDGRHLIFASNRRRPARADLLRVRSKARAGGVADVYIDTRDFTVLKPSMGSNEAIAFQLYPNRPEQRASQVWTIGGPNEYPTQITEGIQPCISPDGKHIAFIGDRRISGEEGDLYVVRSDGTGQTQLTTNAKQIRDTYRKSLTPRELARTRWDYFYPFAFPSWSPDGKYIVYTSMEGYDSTGRPNQDIWIMAVDGTDKTQLTTNGSVDTFPVVSPDGRHIVFLSNRGGRWAIWRMVAPTALYVIPQR